MEGDNLITYIVDGEAIEPMVFMINAVEGGAVAADRNRVEVEVLDVIRNGVGTFVVIVRTNDDWIRPEVARDEGIEAGEGSDAAAPFAIVRTGVYHSIGVLADVVRKFVKVEPGNAGRGVIGRGAEGNKPLVFVNGRGHCACSGDVTIIIISLELVPHERV